MQIVTRANAIKNLRQYIDRNLHDFSAFYSITTFTDKQNKGWKGQVLERLAGLENNNSKAPNGLSFELKSVSFIQKSGNFIPKETMAITMINPKELMEHGFFESHCWHKLKSIILCAVMWHSPHAKNAELIRVSSLDFLESDDLIKEIQMDYEFIRQKLITSGFDSLTGKDGKWIQARTKGQGGINPRTNKRNPVTRAFYAKKNLVQKIFDISS